jgi:tRNA (guanosine-2'-O-)-methyltransferase
VNPDREDRLRVALDQRLGHVRVAAEALYHRHNVSAILRTCDAFGVHHVHLVEGAIKPSRSTSRGVERWLHLHRHADAPAAIDAIRAAGFSIWVADLADEAVAPEALPLERPVCLWFGAELAGVSPTARAAADGVLTVPMRGLAESLNVSVAAALALRPVAERARALGPAALLPEAEREAVWADWIARDEARRLARRRG